MKIIRPLIHILLFFIISNSEAQEVTVSKSPFLPYLVGGLNWTGVSGVENRAQVSSYPTFNAGIGVLTLLNQPRPISLSVEALFSEQGFKYSDVSRNSSPEYVKARYINVPAVLRFNLSKTSNFYFGIGPQIGFLVDGDVITKGGTKIPLSESTVNKTAFDAIGAFGTNIRGKADMGIELRYQSGLNRFISNQPDFRNSILQVRVIVPMFFL
ncbi:PorT family protein [Flavihumibacter sp. R14]|nr:PorT family protein [Flavihumibacter soli]